MRNIITVERNPRNKRFFAGVTGSPWSFWREGATREEAARACAEAVQRQGNNGHVRVYVFTNEGTLFVLYYNDGWVYDMVRPNDRGIVHIPSSSHLGADISAHEAYEIMLHHVNSAFEGVRVVEKGERQ